MVEWKTQLSKKKFGGGEFFGGVVRYYCRPMKKIIYKIL